jgi:hypothetical protein
MVRALLDGNKTQTRRVLKVQPDFSVIKSEYQDPNLWEFRKRFMMYADWHGHEHAMYRKTEIHPDMPVYQHRSPFGEPGDRLWVREAWGYNPDFPGMPGFACYRADPGHEHDGIKWKPSIHMPRSACRIKLEITDVRIERLNDCSHEDAEAEGIRFLRDVPDADETLTPRQLFMCLWDSINEDRGLGWDVNPWVWVIQFQRTPA